MNDLQKEFTNGASLAYKDASNYVRELANKMPPEFGEIGADYKRCLFIIANGLESKSRFVVEEFERMAKAMNGEFDA